MPNTVRHQRRCLIIERHEWETGAFSHQLQFPLDIAREFFGPAQRIIDIRVFLPATAAQPAFTRNVTISGVYANGTRRLNRFPQMGAVPAAFVFIEETSTPNVYNLWWQIDRPIVAARFHPWQQGKNSQYGRGRLAIIVNAPVPRLIDSLH